MSDRKETVKEANYRRNREEWVAKREKDVRAFTEELRDLCDKYGSYLGGCGCCESPYISRTDGTEIAGNVTTEPGSVDWHEPYASYHDD